MGGYIKSIFERISARNIRIITMVLMVLGGTIIILSSDNLKSAVGKIAGLMIFMADVPYIHAILSEEEVKPSRVTWWIWTILSILLVTSYHDVGATNTIWVPLFYVADQAIVALISLHPKYGEGGKSETDIVCILGAIAGMILWHYFGPVVGLGFFIFADACGSWLTIKKAYERPYSEESFTWVITTIGNTLNIFAAEELSVKILAYPIYAAVASAIILFPLLKNLRRIANAPV